MLAFNKLTGANFMKLIMEWRDMWNNSVLDHLRSQELVAGRGIKLQRFTNGTVISATAQPGGAPQPPNSEYTGMFAVKMDEDSAAPPMLQVGPGYVNVNGVFFSTPETTIKPQTGILCITSSIDSEKRKITDPVAEFASPDASHYPIAEIEDDENEGYIIRQYPVTVAVLLLAKMCPFAKNAVKP